MDGVIVDFSLEFSEWLDLDPPQGCAVQKTWRFEDSPDYPNLTKREVDDAWQGIRESLDFWRELPSALTEADEAALHRLSADYDIVYVTDRFVGIDPVKQTVQWLDAQGLPNPYHVLSRRVTNAPKHMTVRRIEAVAALEDSPTNLPELDAVPDLALYRMVRPYNEGSPGKPVGSVQEFCHELLSLV
jgi:hypothetical protein